MIFQISPDTLSNLVFSGFVPLSSPAMFIMTGIGIILLILLLTSLFYRSLDSILPETENADYRAQMANIVFGVVAGLGVYFAYRMFLGSLIYDSDGLPFYSLLNRESFSCRIFDFIMFTSILGVSACWMRFFQILLIEDVQERFVKTVSVVTYFSSFLTAFAVSIPWFFLSNVMAGWWYVFSFSVIFGLIIASSRKEMIRRLQMNLSRSVELNEGFSLKILSIINGAVLILLISLPHFIYRTLPNIDFIALFFILWLVVKYAIPGNMFRRLSPLLKYASPRTRILLFTRYTRKFFLFWGVSVLIVVFILSLNLMLEPGMKNPRRNLTSCACSVRIMGEEMEKYMKVNKGYLPGSKDWADGSWLKRTGSSRQMLEMPNCPSGGVYEYRKWRDEKNRPVFEIRCSHHRHYRMGVPDRYPCYRRKSGLLRYDKEDISRIMKKNIDG